MFSFADAGLSWHAEFPLPRLDKWNLPCARNMVRNSLTRLFMHRRWWVNDPDCIMLRDALHFSDAEIQGIASAKAMSGGSLIISDNLDAISARRLRIAQQLLPPTDVAAVALDLLERETPELLCLQLQSSHSVRVLRAPSADEDDDPATPIDLAGLTPLEGSTDQLVASRSGERLEQQLLQPQPQPQPQKQKQQQQLKLQRSGSGVLTSSKLDLSTISESSKSSKSSGLSSSGSGSGSFSSSAKSVYPYVEGAGDGRDVLSLSMSLSRSMSVTYDESQQLNSGDTNLSSIGASPAPLTFQSYPPQPRYSQQQALAGASRQRGNPQRSFTPLSLQKEIIQRQEQLTSPDVRPFSPNLTLGSLSPSRARQHLRAQANILELGSDVMRLKEQTHTVKRFLKEENTINENDILSKWTVLAVCNWGEEASKDHFLTVKQIFGEDVVTTLTAKNALIDNLIKIRRLSKTASGKPSLSMLKRQTGYLQANPRYLMHIFNFWSEHYSCKVVTLQNDEDSEVAFTGIPRHSANIYSVSLTTDPTLPKYLGSNLHFSCGCEVRRALLTKAPGGAVQQLGAMVQIAANRYAAASTFAMTDADADAGGGGGGGHGLGSGSNSASGKWGRLSPVCEGMRDGEDIHHCSSSSAGSRPRSLSNTRRQVDAFSGSGIGSESSPPSLGTLGTLGSLGGNQVGGAEVISTMQSLRSAVLGIDSNAGASDASGRSTRDRGYREELGGITLIGEAGASSPTLVGRAQSDLNAHAVSGDARREWSPNCYPAGRYGSNTRAGGDVTNDAAEVGESPPLLSIGTQPPSHNTTGDPGPSGGSDLSYRPSSISLASTHVHKLTPKIRSMRIIFEEGALKSASWGGFIWVFLPINGFNVKTCRPYVGIIDIQGSASIHPVDNSVSSFVDMSINPSAGSADLMHGGVDESVHAHTTTNRPRDTSTNSWCTNSSTTGSSKSDSPNVGLLAGLCSPYLLQRVSAPECRLEGAVYRIPVSASRPVSESQDPFLSSNHPQHGVVLNGPGSGEGGAAHISRGGGEEGSGGGSSWGGGGSGGSNAEIVKEEYIVISWIYDMVAQA